MVASVKELTKQPQTTLVEEECRTMLGETNAATVLQGSCMTA